MFPGAVEKVSGRNFRGAGLEIFHRAGGKTVYIPFEK
jgi:hypothetical protein